MVIQSIRYFNAILYLSLTMTNTPMFILHLFKFSQTLNLFFVCISHNWNQNKANILFKSLFLLIFRYNFLIVCLFFAFSHPSWQPLLIKNLKNRSQVATQYVKLLESCQLWFFIIIYLVVTEDLQRNVFFKVFSL